MRLSTEVIRKIIPAEQSITITTERMLFISEDKTAMQIVATYGLYDSKDTLIEQRSCVIQGDHYSLIMSKSPSFAPGKPENEYRETDLWHVIDMVKKD